MRPIPVARAYASTGMGRTRDERQSEELAGTDPSGQAGSAAAAATAAAWRPWSPSRWSAASAPTLGNALRRILLSSLQGAAVTSVQIDGVLHEFSSIAGRARGRDRHRPQHQGNRLRHAGRGAEAPDAQEGRPGRRHRRRHPGHRRHPDAQPGARHLHARRGRRNPHGIHGRDRQGLCLRRAQPAGGRADRSHPGRSASTAR